MSLLASPYWLPSKNSVEVNVPCVVEPSDEGVKTNTSSSAPEAPDTLNEPVVDR